ncbi:hypothetical protein TRFO_33828 [Tritrichomonas foetus]|uniref:Uncharacterized protein n=1 Tax=Tritrichomonas foetus TaxID=1144522 RepID=A0A1J4JMP3_9EUKA|nr:hypothetical protein TRFO_33828 [Tritrichomonas foetus]|eukprot:OHS99703.1 hypothetical protein TRFO_33828 [Tritrichomonas foetus]
MNQSPLSLIQQNQHVGLTINSNSHPNLEAVSQNIPQRNFLNNDSEDEKIFQTQIWGENYEEDEIEPIENPDTQELVDDVEIVDESDFDQIPLNDQNQTENNEIHNSTTENHDKEKEIHNETHSTEYIIQERTENGITIGRITQMNEPIIIQDDDDDSNEFNIDSSSSPNSPNHHSNNNSSDILSETDETLKNPPNNKTNENSENIIQDSNNSEKSSEIEEEIQTIDNKNKNGEKNSENTEKDSGNEEKESKNEENKKGKIDRTFLSSQDIQFLSDELTDSSFSDSEMKGKLLSARELLMKKELPQAECFENLETSAVVCQCSDFKIVKRGIKKFYSISATLKDATGQIKVIVESGFISKILQKSPGEWLLLSKEEKSEAYQKLEEYLFTLSPPIALIDRSESNDNERYLLTESSSL